MTESGADRAKVMGRLRIGVGSHGFMQDELPAPQRGQQRQQRRRRQNSQPLGASVLARQTCSRGAAGYLKLENTFGLASGACRQR